MNKRKSKGVSIDQLPEFYASQARTALANPVAKLERPVRHEQVEKNGCPAFSSPVCITIHSRLHYSRDIDGTSGKALLDGLVKGNILADDTRKEIKSIVHTEEIVPRKELEETLITIEEIVC